MRCGNLTVKEGIRAFRKTLFSLPERPNTRILITPESPRVFPTTPSDIAESVLPARRLWRAGHERGTDSWWDGPQFALRSLRAAPQCDQAQARRCARAEWRDRNGRSHLSTR